ncbi:MGH1-like glycoside hydrolase domain-containing protein [Promicromonospora sukumoe]
MPAVLPAVLFENPETQALLGPAYAGALTNLLVTNTVPCDPDVYRGSGLLDPGVGTFFRAGGGYEQPWTRDAAVNSWNAGSLLAPDVARNTLWAVVTRQDDGGLVVQQDDQWWDQVVWVPAAWHHYLVTGDREFLRDAYDTAARTLALREAGQWSAEHGLFTGPSFFNDGIAGYPDPLVGADDGASSFVLDHPAAVTQLALSTNALYAGAYAALAAMADELGRPGQDHARRAARIAESVEAHFWQPGRGRYGYSIPTEGPAAGELQDYQEGAGLAFVLLFGLADPARSAAVTRDAHVSPHGITDVHPRFGRYAAAGHAGRHNDIVWPVVQGFWADAAARTGDQAAFAAEVTSLARLFHRTGSYYEIYDAATGAVDGGYQNGRVWDSEPEQTWSASAFLRMVHGGLFGLRPTPSGLDLAPVLPAGWGDATLSVLRYRDAELTVRLTGSGARVAAVTLDGVPREPGVVHVPADLSGAHTLDVLLAGA